MPRVGLGITTPAGERPQTYALDRAVTVTVTANFRSPVTKIEINADMKNTKR
jgi:hypothetical protein